MELRYCRVAVFATFAAFCAAASEYSLNLTDATPLASEAPILRRAEKDVSTLAALPPRLAVGDEISLRLFDDVSFSLKVADELPSFGSSRTFGAHMGDGVLSSTIVAGEDSTIIEVRDFARGRMYIAAIKADLAKIDELDVLTNGKSRCLADDASVAEETTSPQGVSRSKLLKAVSGNPFDGNITAPAPVMVDVMMIFDNGAREWVEKNGTYSGSITNFAVSAIARVNSALVNTGLHTNFFYRLVDVMAVDDRMVEITTSSLAKMKQGDATGEGVWGEVKTRRDACGADLVTLMIDTGSSGGTTGYGDITYGTSYDGWVSAVSQSYSCCAVRAVAVDYTLAHEMGHNMGLAHSNTQKNWGKSTFDYANGYNFVGGDGGHYHTIMAYNVDTQYDGYYSEIPYFSSPDYQFAARPVGTVLSNDCTRTLRQTCSAIAKRRAATIPLPSDVIFKPTTAEACSIALETLGGYEIRYTVDGSEPTRESMPYTTPIALRKGTLTIKAVAVVDENTMGDVFEKVYSAAVELDEYVMLESQSSSWQWGDWCDQDGSVVYSTFWNSSSGKTAVLDVGGSINVDRNIDLSVLLADGTVPLEIISTNNALTAGQLEVFGDTTLTGTGFSLPCIRLRSESSLVLSPGIGKTLVLDNEIALSDRTGSLVVSNGTVSVTAKDSAIGPFGSVALRVASGGILSIDGNGWKTGYSNDSPLVIEKGGILRVNAKESIHRPLAMNGGTLEINCAPVDRALDFNDLAISANDDSVIRAVDPQGKIVIRNNDAVIKVAKGKCLELDAGTKDGGSGLQSNGKGIVKKGEGELLIKREPAHSGATTISSGTLAVGFTSTSTNGIGWAVAAGATLRVNAGCSLAVPSLSCEGGSTLAVAASSSAPIAVSNDVALAGVLIRLEGADDFSLGAEYPLLASSGTISGTRLLKTSGLPGLSDGLAWTFAVADGILSALVAREEDVINNVSFASNVPGAELQVPTDAKRLPDLDGVELSSSPLLVEGLDTKAVTITLDVDVPDDIAAAERTLVGWNVGGNLIRCVRRADGVVDCFHGDSGHSANATNDFVLVSGCHTIQVSYYSESSTNGGTRVMVDGKYAYVSTSLKYSSSNVSRVTFGATASDEPRLPYAGLKILGCAVLDSKSNEALDSMTHSGGSVLYSYFKTPTPTVYPLSCGGYAMSESILVANFADSFDSVSVSVIASFPSDAQGSIIGMWIHPSSGWHGAQSEFMGGGKFAIRWDGYQNSIVSSSLDIDVTMPHLYTMTYTSEDGLTLYVDSNKVVEMGKTYSFYGSPVLDNFTFGCGPWHAWGGAGAVEYCPYPMRDFKVYASHIALGTDDRTVSEAAVKESMGYDEPEEPGDPEPKPPATPATVDVLVAYDNGAQSYVANKGVTLAEFAQTQIGKMNDVLVTNRLDRFYSYRLAGVCKVDATYANIEAVSGDLVSGVGPLVALRSSRELCGADTVTLLVNTSGATLGDSIPLSSNIDVASQHECAFSVCSISAVDTGTQHTMIHENAHNMGCGHSRKQDRINSPFEYGRGYYFMDGETKRHTIMAYDVDGTGVYAHPSPYFSTTSKDFGFTLGDKTNNNARVLKETCSEVAKWREGAAIALAGVDVQNVAFATSALYPWSVDGDTIRSFNQTNYQYQCTTPLKATIEGPKALSFKHKSYFGGRSVAGNNYSHFDVLLDDSPVLTQTECTNDWTVAQVEIPEGTHEVIFVFSQRFAMNNSKDYKDGTPAADDAVWLKDIVLTDVVAPTELNIPAGTSVNLSDVGSAIETITGEGTLVCDATLPTKGYGLTSVTWRGTVAFKNFNNENAANNFQVEKYGNANSKVQFTNCKIPYLKNNNATFAGTVVLDGDGTAFSTSNGYSGWFNTFGALEGEGSMSFTGNPTQSYVFNTATNFLGGISVHAADVWIDGQKEQRGRKIVFGSIESASDLPAEPASITVKAGAEAAIGANATWYAYHGVEIAGTLIVKGENSTLSCCSGGEMGVKFTDGATIRFDAAGAKLSCPTNLTFASGTVKVAFADGVTPANNSVIATWPGTSTINGRFKLVGAATNGYELATNATGLVFKEKPYDRLDLSGYSYLTEGMLEDWLDENNFELYEYDWKSFMSEINDRNGYSYLCNYLLGYYADDNRMFEAKIVIDADGNVVITTTEGTVPAVRGLVKKLYSKKSLQDPWTVKTVPFNSEKATTVEKSGETGFYKVEIAVE